MADSDKPPETNDWNEYKRLVLHDIKRLNIAVEKLSDNQDGMRTELTNEIHKASLSLAEKITEGFRDLDDKFSAKTVAIREAVAVNTREIAVIKIKVVMIGAVASLVVAGVVQVIAALVK